MIKKEEVNTRRSIHRIDLSLPIVQTDSYEIFYTVPPSSQNSRTIVHQKPLVDMNKKTTRIRSPARLKHLTGPVFANLVLDGSGRTATSSSTTNDTASSNRLTNSSQSSRIIKGLPVSNQRMKKDGSDRSRSSSGNRLVYESLGSLDDYHLSKSRNYNNIWQNIHHPQLITAKTLHIRRTGKETLFSTNRQVNIANINSLDDLSQESAASMNEYLYERIEQLTKAYFPSIQQIRHTRPSPELISNRMRLHREQKRNFMPVLSRTRVVR